MKIRSIINTQIEFVEDMPEEDFKMFNNNKDKSTYKPRIAEMIKRDLQANKIIVKSYRLEEVK
jgi:hypothetical protein